MILRTLLPVALALPVLACQGTASYQSTPLPPQDVEVSRPDVARVYVMRDDQARGKVRALRVEDSDRKIGALTQGEFLCWERPPGRTLLTFVFEKGRIDGGDSEGLYSLDASPGKAYYLIVHIDRLAEDVELRARAGHPDIELLDPAAGKELVRQRSPVPVN